MKKRKFAGRQSRSKRILLESARKHMKQFDMSSFGETHPSLLRTILEALDEAYDRGREDVLEKIKSL